MITDADSLEYFRAAISEGVTAELQARLEQAVLRRRNQRGDHSAWGLLCEQGGLWNLAFREFQLALRDDPQDVVALERLVHHYTERGESTHAAEMLERLVVLQPTEVSWWLHYVDLLLEQDAVAQAQALVQRAMSQGLPQTDLARLQQRLDQFLQRTAPSEASESDSTSPEIHPTDADCVRFCALFSGRENFFARQWARGGETGYTPIHEPFTPAVAKNHLLGNITVGVYPLRLDNTATFFAVDLDIDRSALQRARSDPAYAQLLRETLQREGPQIAARLRSYGFPVLFENSGYKGRHYWVFLETPETAATLQVLGRCLLQRLQPQLPPGFHLEFFPKQAERKGKGLGNLIKLPLGIHRRTGRRSVLLDENGRVIANPLQELRNIARCSKEVLYAAIERLKTEVGQVEASPGPAAVASGDEGAAELDHGVQEPQPSGPTVPPPPPPPAWTEADFEVDARVCHLLKNCPVLAELKRIVDEHRHLSYEEQLVLIHTLGHLESGPLAVNYLLQKCVDVRPDRLMQSRLRGNPMSCATIRKKIPHITSRVPCNCDFSFSPNQYPHPAVHLLRLPQDSPPPPAPGEPEPLERLMLRLATLDQRRRTLEAEYRQLHHAVVERIRRLPDRVVSIPTGTYRLIEQEGVEELVWEPASGGSTNGAKNGAPDPPAEVAPQPATASSAGEPSTTNGPTACAALSKTS